LQDEGGLAVGGVGVGGVGVYFKRFKRLELKFIYVKQARFSPQDLLEE